MLLGFMPKKEILERYDVLQFYELACALKMGDVQKFDEVIQRHETFFIENGIYLIVEKLKIIGYRNLFKRVSKRFLLTHENDRLFHIWYIHKFIMLWQINSMYLLQVYLITQTHQLDLQNFLIALQFVGETDITMDETHCLVANLIYEGKIKGYISHQHNKLVVSKQNPFPPLNSVSSWDIPPKNNQLFFFADNSEIWKNMHFLWII